MAKTKQVNRYTNLDRLFDTRVYSEEIVNGIHDCLLAENYTPEKDDYDILDLLTWINQIRDEKTEQTDDSGKTTMVSNGFVSTFWDTREKIELPEYNDRHVENADLVSVRKPIKKYLNHAIDEMCTYIAKGTYFDDGFHKDDYADRIEQLGELKVLQETKRYTLSTLKSRMEELYPGCVFAVSMPTTGKLRVLFFNAENFKITYKAPKDTAFKFTHGRKEGIVPVYKVVVWVSEKRKDQFLVPKVKETMYVTRECVHNYHISNDEIVFPNEGKAGKKEWLDGADNLEIIKKETMKMLVSQIQAMTDKIATSASARWEAKKGKSATMTKEDSDEVDKSFEVAPVERWSKESSAAVVFTDTVVPAYQTNLVIMMHNG